MFKKLIIGTMAAALMTGVTAGAALSKEKIKIALIDGLSGPFAANGQASLRELKLALDKFIDSSKYEVEVTGLDNKTSPQVTLSQLDKALKAGAQYIVQGNSSGVAHAIIGAVDKHNSRAKNKVVFLNHSAVDPALTNEKCSYWHFRFDGHVGNKMMALTDAIAADKNIKTVYLIGQDYSFGKAVAAGATKLLKLKRPDIKIVGNELHPIGKVKDFSPYAKKIQASKADAVITGNWGSDMVRLAKSLGAANVDAKIFTFYAAGTGVTKAIGADGEGRVFIVTEGRQNPTTKEQDDYNEEFKKKFPDNDVLYSRIVTMAQMFAKAIEKAGTADTVKVAAALEGLSIDRMDGTKATMRADDHQILYDLYVMKHTNKEVKWDFDKSGYGLVAATTVPAAKNALPAAKCKMKNRPK